MEVRAYENIHSKTFIYNFWEDFNLTYLLSLHVTSLSWKGHSQLVRYLKKKPKIYIPIYLERKADWTSVESEAAFGSGEII